MKEAKQAQNDTATHQPTKKWIIYCYQHRFLLFKSQMNLWAVIIILNAAGILLLVIIIANERTELHLSLPPELNRTPPVEILTHTPRKNLPDVTLAQSNAGIHPELDLDDVGEPKVPQFAKLRNSQAVKQLGPPGGVDHPMEVVDKVDERVVVLLPRTVEGHHFILGGLEQEEKRPFHLLHVVAESKLCNVLDTCVEVLVQKREGVLTPHDEIKIFIPTPPLHPSGSNSAQTLPECLLRVPKPREHLL
jgi:hypothetical protein